MLPDQLNPPLFEAPSVNDACYICPRTGFGMLKIYRSMSTKRVPRLGWTRSGRLSICKSCAAMLAVFVERRQLIGTPRRAIVPDQPTKTPVIEFKW